MREGNEESRLILLVDDQQDVLSALKLLLKSEGFRCLAVSSPADALSALLVQDFHAALLDLNYTRDTTSGREGMDLLSEMQRRDPSLPILVMTAWGTVEGAVEAMRRGAVDYVQKPWDNTRLVTTLRTQIELGQARRTCRVLSEKAQKLSPEVPELSMFSRAMKQVLQLVFRVAPSDANVLICGENGTGKEVVSRRLHLLSKRANQPLLPINCGSLSEGLFESELFGHVKGAFTDAKTDRLGCFAMAEKGTLFLDEIGNLPLSQQRKLLRVLQTGEYQRVGESKVRRADVRILSATNCDLRKEVEQGRFRQDLLYRLNTVEIHLPPLRKRQEDILPLAETFLKSHGQRYGRPPLTLSEEAIRLLLAHEWPGNVRELEHAMERAVLVASSDVIHADELGLQMEKEGKTAQLADDLDRMTLEDAERHLILRALARSQGNVSEAAQALGLSRSALYRRLQSLGIQGSG